MASSGAMERLAASGIASLSVPDLLAIALARREGDVEATTLAIREMYERFGRVQRYGELSPADLQEFGGLEEFEAFRILAAIELGRKVGLAAKGNLPEAGSPEDVARMFSWLFVEKREHFCVALLDARNKVLRSATVHIGTLTMSVVGPREVFREALREGASSIILVHNHPSGDPSPSPEDIELTEKMVELGSQLDIPVQDHVILGNASSEGSFSFRRHNLIR